MSWFTPYGCGYGYSGYGAGYYAGGGFSNSFTLLVVIFVLLVIVGTTYPMGGYAE